MPRLIPPQSLLSRLRNLRESIPPWLRIYEMSDPRNAYSRRRTPFGNLVLISQCALALHLTTRYLFTITSTRGISMMPTIPHSYNSNPVILISSLHRHGKGIQVGDIISFSHPILPNMYAAKRVIGMPGDYVSVVTPGKREPDDEDASEVREMMVQVPEGHCWVAGDNLDWSRDSRMFGPLPLALVRGKVVRMLGPWEVAGKFKNGLVEAGDVEHEIRIER